VFWQILHYIEPTNFTQYISAGIVKIINCLLFLYWKKGCWYRIKLVSAVRLSLWWNHKTILCTRGPANIPPPPPTKTLVIFLKYSLKLSFAFKMSSHEIHNCICHSRWNMKYTSLHIHHRTIARNLKYSSTPLNLDTTDKSRTTARYWYSEVFVNKFCYYIESSLKWSNFSTNEDSYRITCFFYQMLILTFNTNLCNKFTTIYWLDR
jgi:hypothetical protein